MKRLAKLDIPVRKWVPEWLGIVSIFIIILPVILLNGSYTGSMIEVSGTLGTNNEDIMMGYYSASAGMAIAYPIVPKILNAFSSKSLLLADLILQFLLSWICAGMENPDILIICSFAIGFLKGFIMLWFIRRVKTIFSPKDVRSEFYSYFYPLVYGGGQLSMVLTAKIAYLFDWKYMYYFMMILILAAILATIILYRHDRPAKHVPLKELHIKEMTLASAGLLMLMYALNYGKTLDWLSSEKIVFCFAASAVLLGLFFSIQKHSSTPYVNLEPLYHVKVLVGYAYMMFVMFLSTSTTLLTNYTGSILKVDSVHSYSMYIWMLPGYVLAAIICFWWFRWQRWRFRYLIAAGMSGFALFFGMLYFGISPESRYESLFFPIFIRGASMLTLIIAFALFAVEDLNPKHLLSNAFFLITFRSVLAPVIATAFYNNALYRLEQKYIHLLSASVTPVDAIASGRYAGTYAGGLLQGHGPQEAGQLAATSLYSTIREQALLLSLKEILGWMFAITLAVAVISRFIPFHKTLKVRFAKAGDDMV